MKVISNEEAFQKRDTDVSIPLDKTQHDFQFTRNWFRQRNQSTWSSYLLPMFDTSKPLRAIQIGVFEGMDAVWLMQNVLTHEASRLVCIDPWAVTTKLAAEYMEGCYQRALHNLKPWTGKVDVLRGYSQDLLKTNVDHLEFDFIVIDGDHNAQPVCTDAVNSLQYLKRGGYMIFDDVRNRVPKKDHVLDGIGMFLEKHENKVELVWQHRYADCYRKI